MACVWCFVALARAGTPPPVELVDVYRGGVDLSRYWVSEKFDGVRGYWDGHHLWTRGGQRVRVPAWFTHGWPDVPMDGELWVGYGQFSRASVIVRSAGPHDPAWREIHYRVFDLPAYGGDFDHRVPAIRRIVAAIHDPWVVAIRQFHVHDKAALHAALQRVLARGGEGLVLHRGDAPYMAGRGVGLLKVKPYRDAEARVIAIQPGHGRLKGRMGSIEVRTPDGRTFAIGSGFTDAQRADPPSIGAWVTYRYNGLTSTGLPRFARFLHLRPGGPPPG
ncbi:DNA ligase [Oleiagrimonas soli]|uniref:DNA ligase-1 n=1 Tax=Oleiagrimonas soli TaxID=1543381 RepID=A0A841KHU8_9GAMM|nr:DNA ligase [Oleiagrimonas soli]MBB6184625.1 DNA ligase-1 [Oleiagrimonas soli]